MLSTEPLRPAEKPRRRTVRIVKHRRLPKAALVSFGVTAGVAVVAFFAWRVWHTDVETSPYQRTLSDVLLRYQCTRGHVFRARGQVEPIPCPNCGRPANPVAQYICETHGRHAAAVRFKLDARGKPVPDQVRLLPSGQWQSIDSEVLCPRCKEPMRREDEGAINFDTLKQIDPQGPPERPAPSAPDPPRLDSQTDLAEPP